MAKAKGRRSGSRNRGYFFRDGRGWFTKIGGKFVALEFENRDRMRDRNTPAAELKAAVRRATDAVAATPQVVAEDEGPESSVDTAAEVQAFAGEVTIEDVCTAYLARVQDAGAEATLISRRNTLFDWCYGLPSRFIQVDEAKPKSKPKQSDYIHDGYGLLPVSQLKPLHLDQWLQAHPTWKGGRRTRIQAVKRALNYGVEAGMIPANPIKGYKTPKQNGRVTYITPEQEKALLASAYPALATAIKVCIRTGARPGCEFAKLTAAHIAERGDRMEWTFRSTESKTRNLRIIRITEPEILTIVRRQMKLHPKGPIFRNSAGMPWTRELLTEKFRKLKNKLAKKGMEFDKDCCMYSCRHTYAKRVLQGYWSGKPTNIETLAKLMGNSPQVCRDHYLQWCDSYSEPLWESA